VQTYEYATGRPPIYSRRNCARRTLQDVRGDLHLVEARSMSAGKDCVTLTANIC